MRVVGLTAAGGIALPPRRFQILSTESVPLQTPRPMKEMKAEGAGRTIFNILFS